MIFLFTFALLVCFNSSCKDATPELEPAVMLTTGQEKQPKASIFSTFAKAKTDTIANEFIDSSTSFVNDSKTTTKPTLSSEAVIRTADTQAQVITPIEIGEESTIEGSKHSELVIKGESKQVPVPKLANESGIHDGWNTLVQRYVSTKGTVNYAGFKKDELELDAYLDQLSESMPASSDRSPAAMAFWINAYNAFTIKLILKNYPVSSIRDLSNGNPWDVAWIDIGGKQLSLNNIEHDILRPTWKDARIHFAVNCAAKSCPPLANRAFTGDNIETLLKDLTGSFINNTAYNKVGPSNLSLSRIFDWYKDDFGNLPAFINEFTSVNVDDNARITYLDYNWQLNSK